MNPIEIEQTADRMEKSAERGDSDAVAKELHEMAPDDRKAIAAKINEDQKEKPADGLPKMEFYDTGDLKSSQKNDSLENTKTNYDVATGNKTEKNTETWDGRKEKQTFDPQTNKETSITIEKTDGSYVQRTWDAKTGNFQNEHSQNADGSAVHVDNNQKNDRLSVIEYDRNGKVVETSGEDFTTRKFHYDENGKLDQIDGKLGHWDRTVDENGKSVWTNKNSGAVWHGEFDVDKKGELHFKKANGSNFTFDKGNVRS